MNPGADLPTSPLLERIRQGVIGDGEVMDGPYGRPLDFLEDLIRHQVLPRYANTHTRSAGTGQQTGRLREDARRIIRDPVDATDLLAAQGARLLPD